MTPSSIQDPDIIERIRALRAAHLSATEIARKLGLRPAVVSPVVKDLAAADAAQRTEPELAGCWVSPGWSDGLSFDGHPEWPDAPGREVSGGIAVVAIARRTRPHRVSLTTFLVDAYCLGVKDAMPPRQMDESDMPSCLSRIFAAYGGASAVSIPLDLAQHLVLGAVDYARGFGFEPHADFAGAASRLGHWTGPSDITFGREGKPFYIEGPYDDADRILRRLSRAAG